MNRLLLINYHYIHDPARHRHPGIHPISQSTLGDQIDRLSAELTPASPRAVEAFAAGETSTPGAGFHLTFDDGLKDHVIAARDVLRPRELRAVFFISTRPLVEGRAMTVNKVHWLRSQMDPVQFETAFTNRLPSEWAQAIANDENAAAAAETIRYDAPEIARLKYAINFILPYELVDRVTSDMLAAMDVEEAALCRELYMNEDDIRDLAREGHVIGCHGHTHRPFSKLTAEALDAELALCTETLSKLSGGPVEWLSYPWGSPWALPSDPETLGQRHDFKLAITLERAWNSLGVSPYRLSRINTNEVGVFLSGEQHRAASHR